MAAIMGNEDAKGPIHNLVRFGAQQHFGFCAPSYGDPFSFRFADRERIRLRRVPSWHPRVGSYSFANDLKSSAAVF
jgi:hypothetical protein